MASIKSFEQVPVAATVGLLRVSAHSGSDAPPGEPRPSLVADDGRTVSHFTAIPAPPDVDGTLRAAFSVPADILTPETVFSLQFADGLVIALPTPTLGTARLRRRPAAPPPPAARQPDTQARATILRLHSEAALARAELQARRELAAHASDPAAAELADERERTLEDRVVALESEARDHLDRLRVATRERDEALQARREAEQAVEPLTAARNRAERKLAELQDQLHKMRLERDELSRQAQAFDDVAIKARERAAEAETGHQQTSARLAELETWSAELERRLTETTTELSRARAAAQADEADLRSVRGQLAEAQAQLELNQAQIASLSGGSGSVPEATAEVAPADMASDSRLDEIRRAATAEAHAQAERDLADAASGGRL